MLYSITATLLGHAVPALGREQANLHKYIWYARGRLVIRVFRESLLLHTADTVFSINQLLLLPLTYF